MEDDAGARRRAHERQRGGQSMRIDVITPKGRYDKAAILRDAHRHQYEAEPRHTEFSAGQSAQWSFANGTGCCSTSGE